MKRILFLIPVLILLNFCSPKMPIRFQGTTMGTIYLVKIADRGVTESNIAKLMNEVDEALEEVNRQMSTYIPTSEISQFNNMRTSDPLKVSPEFVYVLRLSKQIHKESSGAFDITVGPLVDLWGFGKKGAKQEPPAEAQIDSVRGRIGCQFLKIISDSLIAKSNPEIELDLGAIAKGRGVDIVARLLQQKGLNNFLVEIGGEVVVKGLNGKNKWKIGIDRPQFGGIPGKDLEAILHVTDVSIATSGDYRNYFVSKDKTYSHTIDPVTAHPIVNGVASVTVIAPNCMLADAMATAIMVMGAERGLKWVESKENVECLIILRKDNQFIEMQSSGFDKYLN